MFLLFIFFKLDYLLLEDKYRVFFRMMIITFLVMSSFKNPLLTILTAKVYLFLCSHFKTLLIEINNHFNIIVVLKVLLPAIVVDSYL